MPTAAPKAHVEAINYPPVACLLPATLAAKIYGPIIASSPESCWRALLKNHQPQTLPAKQPITKPTITTIMAEDEPTLAARGAAASAAAFARPPPWGSLPVEQYLLVSQSADLNRPP